MSSATNPISPAALTSPEQPFVWARIRLADNQDVPIIHRLVCRLTDFLHFNHVFSATETSLSSSLFPTPSPPPFLSLTALLLELSPSPIPQRDPEDEKEEGREENKPGSISPVVRRIELAAPVADKEAETFASPRGRGLVVAGFTLCFPKYSAFRAKPGLYVEGLFVRKPWRRRGLGRMLLSAVAAQAARLGLPKVEWGVPNWNAGAVDFYAGMGAVEQRDGRHFKLSGEALKAYETRAEESGWDDACV
ncbi:L-ornithine N5-acetyltransferase NATA1 [Elaeis guineensis]|uniref:L-ornithine N5-acetyltransferase NATA1 n=1 Tax=Elaeis guineensis var. tenera TaxID=51953 RepID=A0A6I9R701_ELAGV|nr:L-ornithine N5-acetyltransferase NATA1 [Elaeis guineensis]